MQETEHYKLKKPAVEDFYNIEDQNGNMDIIDAALAAGDIDCGTFTDADPVMLHDSSPFAHRLLVVDGNGGETSSAGTLEEHMEDPLAHQNIILDGNIN